MNLSDLNDNITQLFKRFFSLTSDPSRINKQQIVIALGRSEREDLAAMTYEGAPPNWSAEKELLEIHNVRIVPVDAVSFFESFIQV